MRVFLDANILVTVLCNEYPQFSFCLRVLSLCDNKQFTVFTSPMCLVIVFYFAQKKNGTQLTKQKISLLASKLKKTMVNVEVVKKAIFNKSLNDFENALEY